MPAPRVIRRFVVVASALAALVAPSTPATAASVTAPPTQGIFENCPLDSAMSACEQRLSVMHSGGLQVVVLFVGNASLPALSQYAATAHGLGMSVMWELSDATWWQQPLTGNQAAADFSQFAAACGCSTNADLLAYMVHWLAALPGTYGYYAADDSMIGPNDQAGISGYMAQIKHSDPSHTVLIGAANTGQRRQYQSIADLSAQEFYPVSTGSLLPVRANQPTWDAVNATAADLQQTADAAGKSSAAILQAFTWGDNVDDGSAIGVCSAADTTASCNARLRYPSGAEQLALRNAVLRNAHPQLILWWSFQGTYGYAQDPGPNYATPPPDEAAARWAGLTAAIKAPLPSDSSPSPTAQGARVHSSIRLKAAKHKRRHGARRGKHRKRHRRHKAHAGH